MVKFADLNVKILDTSHFQAESVPSGGEGSRSILNGATENFRLLGEGYVEQPASVGQMTVSLPGCAEGEDRETGWDFGDDSRACCRQQVGKPHLLQQPLRRFPDKEGETR